jgi:hypothetical protein
MRWQSMAICTALAVLAVAPAHAAEEARPAESGRFSVDLGMGAHLQNGGTLQSLSFGYAPWRTLSLLVNVERNHVPTRVRTYPDGYSVTRGETLTTVAGELRFIVPVRGHLLPYALVGIGAGLSQPNVNANFPHRVTNTTDVFYVGGGVRVPVRRRFAVFVDSKFMMRIDREGEGLGAMLPIRGGVTWGF